MSAAFYGGAAIFGQSVETQVIDHPPAQQRAQFFGLNGQVQLFGGTRGRMIEVNGILVSSVAGTDPSNLLAQEAIIRSYIDGIGRVFQDTRGAQWYPVVMLQYMPKGKWTYAAGPGGGGYPCQPYRCILESLA